jgi:hypothetical protein
MKGLGSTRIHLFKILLVGSVLGYIATTASCLKNAPVGITKVENSSHALKQAPKECLAVFEEFFRYLQEPEPSLISDERAQAQWLSAGLRKALAHHLKGFENRKDRHGYPSNVSFIGVWDDPTTYSVLGSRHYDYRDSDNPDDNRAMIDVLYEWDKAGSLDNNYPGEKSLRSFVFVHERGGWRLDDIYTFTDEYEAAGSLNSYWRRD